MDHPEQFAARLFGATDPVERERLIAEAADLAGVAPVLFARARAGLTSAAPEAATNAEIAARVSEHERDLAGAAAAHRVRGQALRMFGRHAEAIEALAVAADRAREAGDLRLAAQVQIGAIDSLGWLGRIDEAVALARRLERDLTAHGAELDAARVIVNVANLRFRRDQYSKALADYLRAGDIFRQAGDAASTALVDANAANTHLFLNHTGDALSLYDRARKEFEAAGMAQEAAMVDCNVGYVRIVSGMLAEALGAFARARAVFEERGQEVEVAKCDLDSGDAYRALNLFPEALASYERAAGVFERLGIDYELSRSELGRAAILAAMGRYEEASASLDAAESIFRRHRNSVQLAHLSLVRSSLLQATGQMDAAHVEATRAARVFSRHRLPAWAAEARLLPAAADLDARGLHARMHRIAVTARREGRGWLECRAERALGLHYRRTGDITRALRHLRTAVAALEAARTRIAPEEMHVAFLRDKAAAYEDLVTTLLDRGRPEDFEEALQCVEQARSRLLLERLQAAAERRPQTFNAPDQPGTAAPALEALRKRLEDLRAELSRGYHRLNALDDHDNARLAGATSHPGTREDLARLEKDYALTLRQIELNDGGDTVRGTLSAHIPSAGALRSALAEDETLVEYYLSGESVCAFILTRGNLRIERSVASVEEVRHAARRLRFHLQTASPAQDYTDARAKQALARAQVVLGGLYDQLIRPIEHLLVNEKLLVVPHGLLHGLPFHAFHDGREHAIDRWEISYVPSAAVWHAGIRRSEGQTGRLAHNSSTLLMGVPAPGIEHVSSEIADLQRISPSSRSFCGPAATLAAFHTHAACHRYIHLATHALFREDNPLFSGIRFADGWLLARDMYGLRLNCDLATLSACQTGVAMVDTGDELFGLVRGFLAAGVRSVVASLWPADDVSTARLMTRFYRLLAEDYSVTGALRRSQRELRELSPHPYHWAAFATIGQR